MTRYHYFASLALLGVFVVGCTPAVQHPLPATALHTDVQPDPSSYHIGVGDELEIRFFYTPDLNETVQVRPDGKISMMFAQDIQAAGVTPEDLAKTLRHKLASHLKEAELAVIVHGFASQRVFIAGEVGKPGPVQLLQHETLLQVLDEAGWITSSAHHEYVVLIRRDKDGKDNVYTPNIGKILSGDDFADNVMIEAGDTIIVPPADVVSVDRWIDQNIRQTMPLNSSFVINRGVGPSR